MKQNLHFSALFLFLLLLISSCSKISARSMANKQGQAIEAVKLNEIGSGGSAVDLEGTESMNQLMGMEECEKGEEECLQRRMLSEAHLDYIYTQHHKP